MILIASCVTARSDTIASISTLPLAAAKEPLDGAREQPSKPATTPSDDVVATVYGEPITRSQLLAEAARDPYYQGPDQPLAPELARRIVERAYSNLMLAAFYAAKAKELRVDVTGVDEEVAAMVEPERQWWQSRVSEEELATHVANYVIARKREVIMSRTRAKLSDGKEDRTALLRLVGGKMWGVTTARAQR